MRVIVVTALVSASAAAPPPLAALLEAGRAQRRLAAKFGTCEKAREFYNASGLLAETDALLRGEGVKPLDYAGKAARLAFIHIPKNAGTTIEHMRFSTGVRMIRGRRATLPSGERWRGGLRWEGTGDCSCSLWHVPPRFLPAEAIESVYPKSMETFCVVRDPLDKLLSQYRMMAKDRDLEVLATAQVKLCALMRMRFGHRCRSAHADCHLWPQYDYVWDGEGRRTCDRVLFYETLAPEFDALMGLWGDRARLPPKENSVTHHSLIGNATTVDAEHVDARLALMIRCAYQMDLCLFTMRVKDGGHAGAEAHERIFEECAAFHDEADSWARGCKGGASKRGAPKRGTGRDKYTAFEQAAAAAQDVPDPPKGGYARGKPPDGKPGYYCLTHQTMCHTNIEACWHADACETPPGPPPGPPAPVAPPAPLPPAAGDDARKSTWDGRPLPDWLVGTAG